jgi:hypothetical protein
MVPDEPHGIGNHVSHQIAKIEHILAWMEKWTSRKAGPPESQ